MTTPRQTIAPAERADEERDFERLLAELALQFVGSTSDLMESTLRSALQRIGERFDLDRVNFFRVLANGLMVDPISWHRPGLADAPPLDGRQHFPWALSLLQAGQDVCFSSVEEVPDPVDRTSFRISSIQSILTVPLAVNGEIRGAVGYNAMRRPRRWDPDSIHRLKVLAAMFAGALSRQEYERSLTGALDQVKSLSDQLAAENTYLRREMEERIGTGAIIGASEAVRRVLAQVKQVAATDATVLLLGETGTGKELFATEIHQLSNRSARSMVRVHCSAIPASLIESELFGREKGAYTGAVARQVGRFELADQSTIFLDEIGELSQDVQVKLLRVLEDRTIQRLGGNQPIPLNTRIVAATHRDLEKMMTRGEFREDLFYRLNVFPIVVPPLRDRSEDIPPLVWRFVREFSKRLGKTIVSVPARNMAELQRYQWPGNIRELRNVVERAVILATGPALSISLPATPPERQSSRLEDVEREHIRGVLEATAWRIRGPGGAADRLDVKPTTLESRLQKLGLRRPQ
jgi:formate hydrogenlyase transcriptional activator